MRGSEPRRRAGEGGGVPDPKACSVDELLGRRSIEIVLNLTVPKAHVPVALRAIEAGKHTYCEKPLGINREEGAQIARGGEAKRNCASAVRRTRFMGAGIQTARS